MSTLAPRHLVRLLLGDEIERPLAPVIVVTLLSTTAFSALWSYVGIWAITHLHASSTSVGVMYTLDALAAAAGGYIGGQLSDCLGRRLMIALGWGLEAAAALALAAVGNHVYIALALVVLAGGASGPGLAATNAIVADLVPENRREAAYAVMRVVTNLGFAAGPPLGSLALIGDHWPRLFIAIGTVGLASSLVGLIFLPSTTPSADLAPSSHNTCASRLILADRAFLLLLLSTLLGFVVYVAYEVVLPIAAVSSYGLSPAAWGALVVINPLLVTLLQLRLTRAVQGISATPKLGAAMLLMGAPFLLLLLNTSVPMIALVLVIFVLGEMIWAPTSQTLAADLSPPHTRGAYMGAFGASSSMAWAIGPLIALPLRASHGDIATWVLFATTATVGALAGILACRLAAQRKPSAIPDDARQ